MDKKRVVGTIFLTLVKVLLCALIIFILVIAAYVITMFDLRLAIAVLPLIIVAIVLCIGWCIPKGKRKGVLIAGGCIALAAVIALLAVGGMVIYEQAITIDDRYIAKSDYYPFEEDTQAITPEGGSELTFAIDDAPTILANSAYPLAASYIKSVYPNSTQTEYDAYGMNAYLEASRSPAFVFDEGEFDILLERGINLKDDYSAPPEGAQVTLVALDALVIYTHESNPVESLTLEQLRGICTGEITNWAQVGGEDREIELYARHKLTTPSDILEMALNCNITAQVSKLRMVFPYFMFDYYDVQYRNTRGAIGFALKSEMGEEYAETKAIAIEGVLPEDENITDGSYPICDGIYMATNAARGENVQQFISWVTGSQGQEIAQKCGFAPIN